MDNLYNSQNSDFENFQHRNKCSKSKISSFICAGLNFKVNINFIMYFCLCLYILINIISLKCFNISFSSYKI